MLLKASILFLALTLIAAFEGESDTSTLKASGFEGSLGPFSECNHKSPSYSHAASESPVYAGSGKLEVYIDESNCDGTRDDKGAEICYFDSNRQVNHHCPAVLPGGLLELVRDSRYYWQSAGRRSSFILRESYTAGHREFHCARYLEQRHHPFQVSAAEKGAYEVWYSGSNVYSSKNINVGFGDSCPMMLMG
ncbi:hypothetical protein VC83_06297 [Pseudogymnoascus destructans]|uniref:AA1-like domain-containing protein n=2 Tax=Pseudogymnoascus destructans TaxID=655981 RepID=L8GCC1_PSED2|nr:uncharacterized protein VC83_06297 [Pseudogymnoascus destructans]ELR10712.1 hypothetical protein GMDG_04970 [Pseudogymnoascus destructans 20631-21]OAF58991.1 hypothetical protein VC83_06297 [Pseudogymnoascus destructans]